MRIEMFGDEVERLMTLHPVTGEVLTEDAELYIFPATHYVAGPERMERAIAGIEAELEERLGRARAPGQAARGPAAAHAHHVRPGDDAPGRLLLRHRELLAGTSTAARPARRRNCLLDYFPEDFLLVIDESHVTVPQIGGMYEGDMSRKRNLVEHGFRLPSAMDNRPLRWEEFVERIGQTVYLSATPGPYELSRVDGDVVEQVIRPTGLVDPEVIVKPTKGQIDDLMGEIRLRTERDERVLVTTLTKKMAEDLTDYLLEQGIRVRYLHSEVDTLRRIELLRELRLGLLRRPRRHQPAARGPRPARGVARRDPRRRQGGLPALGHLADPDDRPRRAQRQRPGAHVRRHASRRRWPRRSTRPTGAAPSRSPTTRSTASTPRRCARRSPTSPTSSRARTPTPRSCSAGRAAPRAAARRRCRACRPRAVGGSALDVAGMPARELAELIGAAHRPDARGGRRAAVRGGGPAARRGVRPEEGAAADAGGRARLSRRRPCAPMARGRTEPEPAAATRRTCP